MLKVKKMETADEVQSCFTVMSQLRPHLKANNFVNMIQNQFKNGYQLVAVLSGDSVAAAAGFHLRENLAWGKYLYVDDLITDETKRSAGLGKMLLSWLHEEAIKNKCDQVHLDSGVQRKDAHRFYERENMSFSSHHYQSTL